MFKRFTFIGVCTVLVCLFVFFVGTPLVTMFVDVASCSGDIVTSLASNGPPALVSSFLAVVIVVVAKALLRLGSPRQRPHFR